MQRVRSVLESSLRITAAPTLEEACDAALAALFVNLGVAHGTIVLRDGNAPLRRLGRGGLADTALDGLVLELEPDRDEPIVVPDTRTAPDVPLHAALASRGLHAYALLTFRCGPRSLGRLLLAFPEARPLDPATIEAAHLLAALIGSTAARLAAVEEARRESEVRHFLSEVEGVLAASLEVTATLTAVAHLAVPRLADFCVIEVLDEQGRRGALALHHADPRRIELARELRLGEDRATGLIKRVLDRGEPLLVQEVSPTFFAAADGLQRQILDELALVSLAVIPMHARGRAIGALMLATDQPGRHLGTEALCIGTKVADRAAVAVDNARLYQEARRTTERLELALEAGRMGNWEYDVRSGRVWWSPALHDLHGIPHGTFGGTWEAYLADIHPEDRDRVVASVETSLTRESHREEYRIVLPDGTVRWVEGRGRVFRDAHGRPVRLAGVCLDVTDRKTAEHRAEAERAKASKLESVGVLAGGIAHDFNNLLTAVIGNLTLARAVVGNAERPYRWILDAERAALRARGLTRQLLTFAKGGAPVRQRASLGELVRESASFVLSGSNVRPVFEIDPALWPADVDVGQISQVVQNVVLNAQQAMPDGGSVFVRLANVMLGCGAEVPLPAGPYVRLEIADHGHGIAPEHLERIFDPFFTTREKGTGLGLATSYSVVRKHDGHIGVTSRLGAGARFVVHLPAKPGFEVDLPRDPSAPPRPRFRGRALVMDDEDLTLATACNLFVALGFEVVSARDGDAAVTVARIAAGAGRPFDVVVLDLTVRGGKGGRAAVGEILGFQPDARVLVSSGYSDDPVMADCRAYGFRDVVAKPYTLTELTQVLERVLGTPAPPKGERPSIGAK